MIKTKSLLASIAVSGLLLANPALAASTRSSDSLPSVSAVRASAPVHLANEQNPQRARLLALFAAVGAAGLLIAAASGGGGGGNDTPG